MENEVLQCGYSYHTNRFYQSHREPGLNSYLIRLQTEGSCVIWAEGKEYRGQPGELFLLRPGTAYELKVEEHAPAGKDGDKISSGDFYMFCQGEWMREWWARSPKPVSIHIEAGEALISLWKQLIVEKCRVKDDNRELLGHLLRALCLHLDRAISDKDPSYSRPFMASRMKRYVEAHAIETFKVEDVARHVGLSTSRAAHFFKECYGKTMIQYALEIRLTGAVDRIKHTPMTMAQISDSCGFRSYTFFHKAFKEKYGVSPAVFRSQSSEAQVQHPKTPETGSTL